MRELMKRYWRIFRSPATQISLGVLVLGGFVSGILFWGGFNTAMEFTNTEKFCISCHEMRDNVYAELQHTVHYTNRSGVRATCSDCHVPHDWTNKMGRKMEASKEVWGKIFRTIDTPEKFEDKRLVMAQREWRRLKNNDSLECRNCHDYESMDFSQQAPLPQTLHARAFSGELDATCIDCHKGIAHRLPEMDGVPRWPEGL